jgi:hypothetical protein
MAKFRQPPPRWRKRCSVKYAHMVIDGESGSRSGRNLGEAKKTLPGSYRLFPNQDVGLMGKLDDLNTQVATTIV